MSLFPDAVRRSAWWAAVCLGSLLAACASAPAEQFYRLDGPAPAPSAAPSSTEPRPGPVVLVGAVVLPELVDRPQFVTLGSGPRVLVSEAHRWAEPLKPAIGRVVAAQLASALGSARVHAHPQSPPREPALRVSLQVQRFDAELGVGVNDEVVWSVRRLADGALLEGRSAARVAVAGPGHAALATAHASALDQVAREIAPAVAELLKP